MSYEIRKTTAADFDRLLEIYAGARRLQRDTGNLNQWLIHPPLCRLEQDLKEGIGYVICENGKIVGTFAFILGEDETYKVIDGKWLNDEPYGTIHRIAGDGIHKGIVKTAVEFGLTLTDNIRIDTHPDNAPMQALLPKLGFKFTGKIYISDDFGTHSERDAFQLVK